MASLSRLTIGHLAVELKRAQVDDVPGIVRLLADDRLGRTCEASSSEGLQPYYAAFQAIDADADELLVVGTHDAEVVATMQFSIIPGLASRGSLRAQIESVRVDSPLPNQRTRVGDVALGTR